MIDLIAFAGYARTGKDTAAEFLQKFGYARVAFGDIIKRQVDHLCVKHLGFSAFTQNDNEKSQIRGLLEQWGESNYEGIMNEFFSNLPSKAVNSRIVRLKEAERWVRSGGAIVEIKRPGFGPATTWESERLSELRNSGLIDYTIEEEDRAELCRRVEEYAFNS